VIVEVALTVEVVKAAVVVVTLEIGLEEVDVERETLELELDPPEERQVRFLKRVAVSRTTLLELFKKSCVK
jgi:hypothetical protein